MCLIDLEGDIYELHTPKSVGREGSKAWALFVVTLIFLSPCRVLPFLAQGDFQVRLRFARSIIPEEKWGTTRSLIFLGIYINGTFFAKMILSY